MKDKVPLLTLPQSSVKYVFRVKCSCRVTAALIQMPMHRPSFGWQELSGFGQVIWDILTEMASYFLKGA